MIWGGFTHSNFNKTAFAPDIFIELFFAQSATVRCYKSIVK